MNKENLKKDIEADIKAPLLNPEQGDRIQQPSQTTELNSENNNYSEKNDYNKLEVGINRTESSRSDQISPIKNRERSNSQKAKEQKTNTLTVPPTQFGKSMSPFTMNFGNGDGNGNGESSRRNRIQSDFCEDVLTQRRVFFQSQIIPQQRKNTNKRPIMETSVIVPFEKSQYLSTEYLQTFHEKWEWPASVEKALDHEKATSIGTDKIKMVDGNPVIDYVGCKCCLNNINKEQIKWWKADVDRDLPYRAGTAIPIYMHLIKYYMFFILLIFLTNGVYIIYQTYNICQYSINNQNYCYNLGLAKFASKEYIRQILTILQADYKPGKPGKYDLQVFTWLNFASFFIIMISTLFVDVYISYYQRTMGKPASQQCARTIIVQNIPCQKIIKQNGVTMEVPYENDEDMKKYILRYIRDHSKKFGYENKYEIKNIFMIYDYSKYDEFFQKRTNMYYKLKPILHNQDMQNDLKIIEMKAYTYFWNLYLKQEITEFGGKAIITFANSEQAYKIRNQILKQNYCKKYCLKFLKFMRGIFCSGKIDGYLKKQDQIEATYTPEPYEIKWQNLGIKSGEKTKNYALIWLFTIIAVVIFGILILVVSRTLKSGLIYFFAFLFLIIIHGIVMQIIVLKRKGKTNSSNAYYLLSNVTPFQLIFICVMPILFYVTSYQDDKFKQDEIQSKKVLALFMQMIIFSCVSLFFCVLDLPSTIHRARKRKIMKYKLESQFCQSNLNEAFEKPEFQLELFILQIIKIWSFVALHSFLSPLSLLIALILLGLQYYLSKFHLFTTYTVKQFKSVNLVREYLWYYGHYFQLIVLAVFLILQDRKDYTENLVFYLAIATYVICVIVNVVRYFKYQQDNRKKRKQDIKESMFQESQVSNNKDENQDSNSNTKIVDDDSMLDRELTKQFRKQSEAYEGEQTYARHYNGFKKKYYQPKLEQQIQSVLGLAVQDFSEIKKQQLSKIASIRSSVIDQDINKDSFVKPLIQM